MNWRKYDPNIVDSMFQFSKILKKIKGPLEWGKKKAQKHMVETKEQIKIFIIFNK